jgi:hypothetical protein
LSEPNRRIYPLNIQKEQLEICTRIEGEKGYTNLRDLYLRAGRRKGPKQCKMKRIEEGGINWERRTLIGS